MKKVLRERKDLYGFVWAFLGPIILIAPFFIEFTNFFELAAMWLVVWACLCRHNYLLHNHVHFPITVYPWLNKLISILYAICTGMPEGNWKIMHVHGHHVEHKILNLPSRKYIEKFSTPHAAKRMLSSGVIFSIIRIVPQAVTPFIVLLNGTRSNWREKRAWSFYYLIDYLILSIFIISLFVVSPLKLGIFVIGLYIVVAFGSICIDYVTHIQTESQTLQAGRISFSNVCHDKTYNRHFWNFGHHVGHHIKPNVHWSKLPEIERKLGVLSTDDEAAKDLNIFGLFRPTHISWKIAQRAK